MRLIKTHDGLIGLMIKDKMVWCDDVAHAIRVASNHYNKMEVTTEMMTKDIEYALDHMARTGDTIAEFGIYGSFIYSMSEAEYEF